MAARTPSPSPSAGTARPDGRIAGSVVLLAFLALFFAGAAPPAPPDALREFDALEKEIRDNRIPRDRARARVIALHPRLAEEAAGIGAGTYYFPVKGGRLRDVGGTNGSGYEPRGYNYYDGTLHHAHPAHDIFIDDRDRDSRRDSTGKPAEVLSFTGALVVAVNREWEPGSGIRGGKYVWTFNPRLDTFFAYAHLEEVRVKVGQRLSAGQVLGTVGRTGKNARPRRSPTHLHFTALAYDGGRMTPVNTWSRLVESVKTKP